MQMTGAEDEDND